VSKYFVFASDARSYLDLVNVVKELQNKNEEYFFLYNLNPFTVDPKTNLNAYNYDTNIQQSDKNKPIVIPTLGFELPFRP